MTIEIWVLQTIGWIALAVFLLWLWARVALAESSADLANKRFERLEKEMEDLAAVAGFEPKHTGGSWFMRYSGWQKAAKKKP